MSKTNIDELFKCSEGEMPEQLPLLTDEERNRLYKMSERKYNKDADEKFVTGDSVSGVERYSHPVWKRRLASVAAAGVLLAGSGGLAYYIQNSTLDGFNDNMAVDMISPSSDKDYEKIASYLLDGYTDFCSRMEAPESVKSTRVTLHIEGEDVVIARYADKDINSMADFRALGAKYMTEEYLDNNYDFTEAPDKSEWGEGYNIAAYEWYADNANAMFFIYNGGELYTYYHEDNLHWCYKDVEVSDIKDDSFTIRATMEGCINSETVYCPRVFQAERNSDDEWRIASTKIDEEKVQTQPFDGVEKISETCKRFSDRYLQLKEYIFERPASEDDTLAFTVQISGTDVEEHYDRIVDDYTKENNVFWNVHSIDEIKQLSGMDDALFAKIYGRSFFYKLDDSCKNGDYISFEGQDPYFIEYKGAIYSQTNWNHLMDYELFAPFTDEPEIVSRTDNEIVFRRQTGYRSQTAELNVMPLTFEFTLWKGLNSGDEWKLSAVTYEANESISEPTETYFKSMAYSYNHTVNALMSYDYLDMDRAISYYANVSGKTELQADYAPYKHPDFVNPKNIDDSLKELFTESFLDNITSPYYDALNSKTYFVNDFGEYPDGYKWDNLSSEELLKSPFASMFIYRDGELYRNTNKTLRWLPYYSINPYFEVRAVEETNGRYTVDVECTSTFRDENSNPLSLGTKLRFIFVYEDGSWKIDEVGTLEQ